MEIGFSFAVQGFAAGVVDSSVYRFRRRLSVIGFSFAVPDSAVEVDSCAADLDCVVSALGCATLVRGSSFSD